MRKCNDLNNDVSEAALTEPPSEAVAGALAGDFRVDPLIGKDSCRAPRYRERSQAPWRPDRDRRRRGAGRQGPLHRAAQCRHPVDQGSAAVARRQEHRRDPFQDQALGWNSEAAGIVNVDLVVVDPEAGWAGAYEIKRGNGATEHGKRRPIMRRLRAVRLVLASFVDQLGYGPIKTATSAVIDYFGASGFDAHFTITRDQARRALRRARRGHVLVDAMTKAARDALEVELPALFEPVFEQMTSSDAGMPALPNPGTSTVGKFVATAAAALQVTTAAPVGPGRRQPQEPPGPPLGPGKRRAAPWGAVLASPSKHHRVTQWSLCRVIQAVQSGSLA